MSNEEATIKEEKDPVVEFADLNVLIRKIEPLAEQPKRYARISVYASKKNGNGDLKGTAPTTAATLTTDKGKIKEESELALFPGTSCKVWNEGTLTAGSIKDMQAWGCTIVVLSGAKDAFQTGMGKEEIKSVLEPDTIIWYTEDKCTTTFKSIVSLPNRGVMIDTEKKGKLLYTLTWLLSRPKDFPKINTMNTLAELFEKNIIDPDHAKSLDDLGYSYYFRATDWIYPRGLWLGKDQARKVYADLSIKYDVKQAIGHMITRGMAYTDTTVSILQARLMNTLRKNPFLTRVEELRIPPQPPSNKVKGLIEGIYIKYEAERELRTVNITMESVI